MHKQTAAAIWYSKTSTLSSIVSWMPQYVVENNSSVDESQLSCEALHRCGGPPGSTTLRNPGYGTAVFHLRRSNRRLSNLQIVIVVQ